MVEVPLKGEFGPTLGELLAPRWGAASVGARTVVSLVGLGLLAALVGLALTLASPTFSRGGSVPFSFTYRGLYRAGSDAGGYVKVQQYFSDGSLKYSFAVEPLRLPPYEGQLGGAIPVFATSYIRALRERTAGFELSGEGRTRAPRVPGYEVLYTLLVKGKRMLGRDIMLLPESPGARDGVTLVMLSSPRVGKQVRTPAEVGSTGVLSGPLKSFTFG